MTPTLFIFFKSSQRTHFIKNVTKLKTFEGLKTFKKPLLLIDKLLGTYKCPVYKYKMCNAINAYSNIRWTFIHCQWDSLTSRKQMLTVGLNNDNKYVKPFVSLLMKKERNTVCLQDTATSRFKIPRCPLLPVLPGRWIFGNTIAPLYTGWLAASHNFHYDELRSLLLSLLLVKQHKVCCSTSAGQQSASVICCLKHLSVGVCGCVSMWQITDAMVERKWNDSQF